MSKRSRRDVKTSLSKLSIATHRVPELHRLLLPPVTYKTNIRALQMVEDRRTFYPDQPLYRPARTIAVGRPARLKLVQNPRYTAPSQTKGLVAFAEPQKVPICIRRKERKQVLHAKGIAGSKKRLRPGRRSEFSSIHC